MPRDTLYIINPAAGAGRAARRWAEFERRLQKEGLHGDQRATTRPGEAVALARKAAHQYRRLVAIGGDGTMSEVASGILTSSASEVTLSVVPFGTGNDTAAALGIRTDADAFRALSTGKTQAIDVIEAHYIADGAEVLRHALSFTAFGISGELLRVTNNRVKRMFGQRLAYPVGLLRSLWSYQAPWMRITYDGERLEDRFLFVCASNAECFGGGIRIAPGARVSDGVLNVNLVQDVSRWEALLQVGRLYRGRHTGHPKVRYVTARSLTVESDPPIEVALDGDLVGYTPARLEVRSKVLQALLPYPLD
jgi:YegS/Rv2252/BmrU family lipid kinase